MHEILQLSFADCKDGGGQRREQGEQEVRRGNGQGNPFLREGVVRLEK